MGTNQKSGVILRRTPHLVHVQKIPFLANESPALYLYHLNRRLNGADFGSRRCSSSWLPNSEIPNFF